MTSLGIVRDRFLNPWDCGNYYGLADAGVDLYLCGTRDVDWDQIMEVCPKAHFFSYNNRWEVLELELDVLDVPDGHYDFSQYFAERHPRTVMVAWDNLPGKNTLDPQALKAQEKAWKHVARSHQAVETLKYDGVPEDKIKLLYGAVDTDFFHPEYNERQNAILFVGRLTLEKGLLDLIWAMRDIDAELWIVGEGDKAYFEPWCKEINVKWLGQLSRKELVIVYNQAKVFCVPSVPLLDKDVNAAWLEQFGQVFLEAMACGLPIVSTLSGAIPEVVQHGGTFVHPRDYGTLRTAISQLLTDERQWMVEHIEGVRRAKDFFCQKVIAEQIKEWYEL